MSYERDFDAELEGSCGYDEVYEEPLEEHEYEEWKKADDLQRVKDIKSSM